MYPHSHYSLTRQIKNWYDACRGRIKVISIAILISSIVKDGFQKKIQALKGRFKEVEEKEREKKEVWQRKMMERRWADGRVVSLLKYSANVSIRREFGIRRWGPKEFNNPTSGNFPLWFLLLGAWHVHEKKRRGETLEHWRFDFPKKNLWYLR